MEKSENLEPHWKWKTKTHGKGGSLLLVYWPWTMHKIKPTNTMLIFWPIAHWPANGQQESWPSFRIHDDAVKHRPQVHTPPPFCISFGHTHTHARAHTHTGKQKSNRKVAENWFFIIHNCILPSTKICYQLLVKSKTQQFSDYRNYLLLSHS